MITKCIQVLLCVVCIYFYKKIEKIKLKNIDSSGSHQGERSMKKFIDNLSIIEKLIIKTIYLDNKLNQNTSINKLNKILGVEKKEEKLQNNLRGEIIKSINQKFKTFYTINENLIERQKTTIDKRQVEYLINSSFVKKFNEKIFSDS